MANNKTSSAGGVIGFSIGVFLLAVIAGTPFYLTTLQSESQALDALIRNDVEALRRVLLKHDGFLNVIDESAWATMDDEKPGKKGRGLTEENAKLLKAAEGLAVKMSTAQVGTINGSRHLAANQVRAILSLMMAQAQSGQAEFAERLADAARRTAGERAGSVVTLNRQAELAELQKPTKAVAELDEQISKLNGETDGLNTALISLTQTVESREKEIRRLTELASKRRMQLQKLEGQPWSSELDKQVQTLSQEARAAEAEADALQNGTLAGATPVFEKGEDWVQAAYQGGERREGVRDLREQIAAMQEQIKGRQTAQKELEARRTTLKEAGDLLENQKAEYLRQKAEQAQEIDDILNRAANYAKAASDLRIRLAAVLEKQAFVIAKNALDTAKQRKRDADAELRELGTAVDERLQWISKDSETEASIDCLLAEAAYQSALNRLNTINAMQAAYEAEVYFAKLIGREVPSSPGPKVEEIKTKAAADLKMATDKLKEAKDLIKRTNLRTPDGQTVSGTNYAWAIDVGQAAIAILESNLAGERTARLEAQKKAYALLTEAAKDREQSPLLTPAIETLQHLQQTVK